MKPRDLLFLILSLPLGLFSQVEDFPPPDPNAFVLLEKEPVPLNLNELKKAIGYPPLALEADIEGRVILRILIDEKGQYKEHLVMKDPHPLLTKAVEAKIPMLKFSPGISHGAAIRVWVTIPFEFKLTKGANANATASTTFYDLQEALKQPSNVQELHLQGQGLKTFPMEVLQFPNLRLLELSHIENDTATSEIYTLKNLEWIGMSHNQLVDLPEDLWLLPRLRGINIQENGFSKKMRQSLAKDHTHMLYPKDDKGKIQW